MVLRTSIVRKELKMSDIIKEIEAEQLKAQIHTDIEEARN